MTAAILYLTVYACIEHRYMSSMQAHCMVKFDHSMNKKGLLIHETLKTILWLWLRKKFQLYLYTTPQLLMIKYTTNDSKYLLSVTYHSIKTTVAKMC